MKIALDGMGGDKAPRVNVEGAVNAANEFGYHIILVGQEYLLNKELAKHKVRNGKVEVHNAPQVVGMAEPPISSIRAKKESSINIAVNLVKEKKADAFVSAGNTGAVVCAATFNLKLLEGVDRPGISIVFPTSDGSETIMIDVGANIDPKPEHLFQYGLMGEAYSRYILGKTNPSLGLLSIGAEASKGTGFVKDTHKLLNASKLNFLGNIEGQDIFTGKCDVVLCDGFVGNVALKIVESLAKAVGTLLKRELTKSFMSKIGVLFFGSTIKALKKELDYAEYGGAPLLGVDGAVVISHGSSNSTAIKNALKVASEFSSKEVNKHIIEGMRQYRKELL